MWGSGSSSLRPRLRTLVPVWAAAPPLWHHGWEQACGWETCYQVHKTFGVQRLFFKQRLAGVDGRRNEVPTKRVNPAFPKARGKQIWAVQSEQEKGLLSLVSLQP